MLFFSKLFRVKEGKLERVKEWMSILSSSRRKEAIETFEYENVKREVVVVFQGDDGSHYLIGLNEASSDYRAGDPDVSINQEHSEFKKECLEPVSKNGQVLLDLSASP